MNTLGLGSATMDGEGGEALKMFDLETFPTPPLPPRAFAGSRGPAVTPAHPPHGVPPDADLVSLLLLLLILLIPLLLTLKRLLK